MSSEDKDGAWIVAIVTILSLISAGIVAESPDTFGLNGTGESFVGASMAVFYALLAILALGIITLSWLSNKTTKGMDWLNKTAKKTST